MPTKLATLAAVRPVRAAAVRPVTRAVRPAVPAAARRVGLVEMVALEAQRALVVWVALAAWVERAVRLRAWARKWNAMANVSTRRLTASIVANAASRV